MSGMKLLEIVFETDGSVRGMFFQAYKRLSVPRMTDNFDEIANLRTFPLN